MPFEHPWQFELLCHPQSAGCSQAMAPDLPCSACLLAHPVSQIQSQAEFYLRTEHI